MADITNQQLLTSVNQTIQGLIDVVATKDDLKAFVTKDDVRAIVREEVADIRDAQLHQGALLEDMDDKISKIAEAVDTHLSVGTTLKNHESRLGELEISKRLVISTVRDHSAQLKAIRKQKT